MRTQLFDAQFRYYDTSNHKEDVTVQAQRKGKSLSEWMREATREKLNRERVEREKSWRRGERE